MNDYWWEIKPETLPDTPFLAVYLNPVKHNIELLIDLIDGDTQRLRPHIKTHKCGEILNLYKSYGINKVKCATIAEAELSAIFGIKDILLAYQPTGGKRQRWIDLILKYPDAAFSVIVDDLQVAQQLSDLAVINGLKLTVYLDLNTGMNRTGVDINADWALMAVLISRMPNLNLAGLHIYDGHIKGLVEQRKQLVEESLAKVMNQLANIENQLEYKLKIVAGGSNTFPIYANCKDVECSPGTFVFWDVNYQTNLPEQPFETAALLVGSIISKPTPGTLCVDLGYKSVAAENPLDKRLVILNDKELVPIAHSEEHLVLENRGTRDYLIGEKVYAIPYHVCPTCALYDDMQIIDDQHEIVDSWAITARKRKINI
ncbi:alanine racemase [Solitalea longa]|uniref:Alanine racemase n=2 Tax=Solitalea longa TaxID=2079460 RepID=A0A2S4ZZL2_9SPHI|nr:alanine racemase [Solitalea longa]